MKGSINNVDLNKVLNFIINSQIFIYSNLRILCVIVKTKKILRLEELVLKF